MASDLQGWSGLGGTGVQTFFSWGNYNMSGFNDNVKMRQSQKYQKKNYQLSWTSIARDDIRNMMGISVNRINNYMVVSTLILSVAASAMMGISFNADDPDFLVHAFFCCIGISISFLMVSIMFSVTGQNSAFTNTMKLLTYEVRPENPAEYNHDYMKQVQHIEKLGSSEFFRFPGTRADYALGGTKQKGMPSKDQKMPSSDSVDSSEVHSRAEDLTVVETLEIESSHLWYLTKFWNFSRLWLPYDSNAKLCMGQGIVALGHASAYFALARLIQDGRHLTTFSASCLTFGFEYLVGLVVVTNFQAPHWGVKACAVSVLVSGPCLATLAAFTDDPVVSRICVPLCFLSHTCYYFSAFWLAQNDSDDARLMEKPNDMWKALGHDPLGGPDVSADREISTVRSTRPRGDSEYTGLTTNGSTWPTETKEFDEKVHKTRMGAMNVVRCTLLVCFALNTSLFVWAITKFWLADDPNEPLMLHQKYRQSLVWERSWLVDDLAMQSDEFVLQPHSLACAADYVFMADSSQIFQLSGGVVTQYECDVEGEIEDVTIRCGEGFCWPVVLVRKLGGTPKIFDCKDGDESMLLQALDVEHFLLSGATSKEGSVDRTMFVSHGGELDMYSSKTDKHDWEPRWALATDDSDNITALGQSGSHLFVFHAAALEVRDAKTWKKHASYSLQSSTPIVSGCVDSDTSKLLVLARSEDGNGGSSSQLVQLALPALHTERAQRSASDRHRGREFLKTLGQSMFQRTRRKGTIEEFSDDIDEDTHTTSIEL